MAHRFAQSPSTDGLPSELFVGQDDPFDDSPRLVLVVDVPVADSLCLVLGHAMRAIAEREVVGEAALADRDVSLLGVEVASVEAAGSRGVQLDESSHTN